MNVRRYPLINAETLKKYQDDVAWVIIDCRFDLMDNSFGSYGESNEAWTADEAKGFIKLSANAGKIYQHVNK